MPETPHPRRRVTHPEAGKEITNQDDRLATDINTIVAQYQRSGTMPRIALRDPIFDLDIPPGDLMEVTERIADAEDRFMQFDSSIRKAAGHDYRTFIAMLDTPEGLATLTDAGLETGLAPSPQPVSAGTPNPSPEAPPPPSTPPTDET